jgi:prenyltransferase beta subunit
VLTIETKLINDVGVEGREEDRSDLCYCYYRGTNIVKVKWPGLERRVTEPTTKIAENSPGEHIEG